MILFASGRCDLVAFFTPWLLNRFTEGYIDVRNPFDEHMISRILLDTESVDMILFCTKDPRPILPYLDRISFPFLFHVTFTPYFNDLEPFVYDKKVILSSIISLSSIIGPERVIVRYDPILFSAKYTMDYHIQAFTKLCSSLSGHVKRIIFSFVDLYKNTQRHRDDLSLTFPTVNELYSFVSQLSLIASKYDIALQTCAEPYDFTSFGVEIGNCVDRVFLESLFSIDLSHISNAGVRKECSCIETVDIGDYNCCHHLCKYCYANYEESKILSRMHQHDPASSLLIGHICESDRIVIRKEKRNHQIRFF